MEKASISELKNKLSAYLRRLKASGEIVITERDVPIARILPIDIGNVTKKNKKSMDEAQIKSLEKEGVLRPPVKQFSPPDPLELGEDVDLVKAILEEREDRF